MKISVIICTRNQVDYIKTAISSILSNSYKHFEILVIDQSADDLTKKIVQSYAKQDRRVKYFHMPTKGKCRGLNYGIKMSQGKIIAITDSDCQVSADWIEKILFVFNSHSDVDIVYGSLIPEIDSEKKWFVPGVIFNDRVFSGPCSKIFENGMGANMAIRKRLFENIGYFDETLGPGSFLPSGEEWDFSYRALKKGFKVAHSSLVKVKHCGRRDFVEFMELLKKYRVYDAVVFSKHIRCYDLNAVFILVGMYIVNVIRIFKSALFDNLGFIKRIAYKCCGVFFLTFCFLKGMIVSMKYPIDRKNLIFLLKDK